MNDKWELIYRVSNASRTYIGGAIDRTIRSENYYIANNQIAETLTSREMLIYFNIIDNSSGPNFFPNHRWQIRMLSSEYLFLTNGDFYFGSETNWRTQTSYYFRKVNE